MLQRLWHEEVQRRLHQGLHTLSHIFESWAAIRRAIEEGADLRQEGVRACRPHLRREPRPLHPKVLILELQGDLALGQVRLDLRAFGGHKKMAAGITRCYHVVNHVRTEELAPIAPSDTSFKNRF